MSHIPLSEQTERIFVSSRCVCGACVPKYTYIQCINTLLPHFQHSLQRFRATEKPRARNYGRCAVVGGACAFGMNITRGHWHADAHAFAGASQFSKRPGCAMVSALSQSRPTMFGTILRYYGSSHLGHMPLQPSRLRASVRRRSGGGNPPIRQAAEAIERPLTLPLRHAVVHGATGPRMVGRARSQQMHNRPG